MVTLTDEEAAALARYIGVHGIKYGRDDGLMQAIRNKLPELPVEPNV